MHLKYAIVIKFVFFKFIIGMYVRTLSQKQQQDTSFVTKRKSCCFITELYLIKTTRFLDIDTIIRIDLRTGCARMHHLCYMKRDMNIY